MRRDLVSLTTSCLLAPPRTIGLVNYHRIMARTSQLRSRATKGEPPTGAGEYLPKSFPITPSSHRSDFDVLSEVRFRHALRVYRPS